MGNTNAFSRYTYLQPEIAECKSKGGVFKTINNVATCEKTEVLYTIKLNEVIPVEN